MIYRDEVPHNEVGPRDTTPEGTDTIHTSHCQVTDDSDLSDVGRPFASSQQVSFWQVHKFVDGKLKPIGRFPMIGTPEWCALDDRDARKWAAVYDAAQHWALRLETCQEQKCEASRNVSAAEDWSAVAREITQRRGAYIPREVM